MCSRHERCGRRQVHGVAGELSEDRRRLDDVGVGVEHAVAGVHGYIRRAAIPPSSGMTVPLM